MTTMEFPGPLMNPVFVRSISEAGIAKVLQLADDAGLLGPAPDYELPGDVGIADAPNTVVSASSPTAAGARHVAYALGLDQMDGGPSTPRGTTCRRSSPCWPTSRRWPVRPRWARPPRTSRTATASRPRW